LWGYVVFSQNKHAETPRAGGHIVEWHLVRNKPFDIRRACDPKPTLSVPVLDHLVGAPSRSSCARLDQATGKHRVLATLLAQLERWTWVVQVAGITPERARRPEHQALGCG
jgi:hypothetical protein